MGGFSSAYLGADPCVGSKTATSSPMLPEAANPSPPTSPAKASERMSPNRFEATMTLYSSGSCSATSAGRRCSWTRARCPDNSSRLLSPLLPSCLRFRARHWAFANGHALEATFLCVFKGCLDDALSRLASDDAATDGDLGSGHVGKSLEARMAVQRGADDLGGFVHSTPAYMPSVPWRKTVVSIFGSSNPPEVFLRM